MRGGFQGGLSGGHSMGSVLRFLGVSMLTLSVMGAGTAGAALGDSATTVPVTCLVSVPGFADVTGTGRFVISATGSEKVICQAQFPVGTTLPGTTTRYESGP